MGIAGDSLTFAGSMVLVFKELQALRDFREISAGRRHLDSGDLGDLPLISPDKKPLKTSEDVELFIIGRDLRRSWIGAALLALGFLLLLITRFAENSEGRKPLGQAHLSRGAAAIGCNEASR